MLKKNTIIKMRRRKRSLLSRTIYSWKMLVVALTLLLVANNYLLHYVYSGRRSIKNKNSIEQEHEDWNTTNAATRGVADTDDTDMDPTSIKEMDEEYEIQWQEIHMSKLAPGQVVPVYWKSNVHVPITPNILSHWTCTRAATCTARLHFDHGYFV